MKSSKIFSFFLVLSCFAVGIRAQDISEVEHGLFSTSPITLTEAAPPQANFMVRSAVNLSGELTITAGASDQVTVTFQKRALTEDRSQAFDYIDLISVDLSSRPSGAVLELRAPNPPPWEGENEAGMVQAEITVPEGTAVTVEAPYFDVTAEGKLSSVVIPSSLGRLKITGVEKRTDISTSNRRVILADLTGEINASTTNSTIVASNITAKVGTARFRNENGDIRIEGFTGEINVRNSFGRISITQFVPIGNGNFIRGNSSPILLEINKIDDGQLVVTNRYEDIDFVVPKDVSAFFSLSVGEDGQIETTNLPVVPDLVQRRRLNLIAGKGAVDISGSISGKGNIFVRGTDIE